MFIYSSVCGHLGSFHLLVLGRNAAMITGVQICVQVPALTSLGSLSRSRIAGSCDKFVFNFMRNLHTIFITKNFKHSWKLEKEGSNTHMLTSQIENKVSGCPAPGRRLVRDVLHSVGLRASGPRCLVLAVSSPGLLDTSFQVFFPGEKIHNSLLLTDQGTCRDPQSKFNKC